MSLQDFEIANRLAAEGSYPGCEVGVVSFRAAGGVSKEP